MHRNEFPITKDYIFLDHAGVAPVSMRVKKAVEGFISEALEVGLSNYKLWMDKVEEIRTDCAKLINAGRDEIAFIKNTSQGLSIVAKGLEWNEGENLLVCEKEFPANIYPWLDLQSKGIEVKFIPFREGRILFEDIEKLIDPKTRLITISSVQFSNGFKINLKRWGNFVETKRCCSVLMQSKVWE